MRNIMNKINPTQLLSAYEATRVFSHEDGSIAEHFLPIEQAFEDKKTNPDASIMIYGVYNAGKSTLINVLLGREEAAVEDIPTTDQVTAYQWGLYSILDTPGVDAPIEHEKVTNEQMLKADAVIFVVNPVGTAEEVKTLSVLMDLLKANKKVFLVFNEKTPISEKDFIRLKNQTRERLQQMAKERGLDAVLADIPIIKINAKRALQGHLKEKPNFIELSGYPIFEKQLKEFLQSISPDDIYSRLKNQLVEFLNNYVVMLNDRSTSEITKKYDELLYSVGIEKTKLCQNLDRELSCQKINIYEKSKALIQASPENCQPQIEKLLENSGQDFSNNLNAKLLVFVESVQNEIKELEAVLPNTAPTGMPVTVPVLEAIPEQTDSQDSTIKESKINPTLIKGTVDQITALARPEHIVESLKLIKSTLPSLMKGIGPKTMEKWASVAMAKWIPHVGTAISVASVLFSIFSGDSEEKFLQQQNEKQKREKERALQQMDDLAREISEGFETSIKEIIEIEINNFFADIFKQIDILRQGFSKAEQTNSRQLEKLLEIQQLAISA